MTARIWIIRCKMAQDAPPTHASISLPYSESQNRGMTTAKHEATVPLSVQEALQLSSELWNDPRCQGEADGLVRLLVQPAMLELFAIHEAGHEIYYRRAACTAFIFDSPRIIYNEKEKNPFTEQRARIESVIGSSLKEMIGCKNW